MELRGINYGHNLSATAPYEQRVRADLAEIGDAGYKLIRVAMPPSVSSTPSINLMKYITETALSMGFQVMLGVVTYGTPVTATLQAAQMTYVRDVMVPYVNTLATDRVFLCIDNEIEEKVDGTTLTIAQAIDNLVTLAGWCKDDLTDAGVVYASAGGNMAAWSGEDLSDFNYLGFNLYFGYEPTVGGFYDAVIDGVGYFGDKFAVTEWNTTGGFPDAADYTGGSQEYLWGKNLALREEILTRYHLPQMVFSYADGSFGVPPNTFGLVQTNGQKRDAWYMINQLS